MSVKTMKAPAAKPILKWAGGKTQMLGELMPRVPKTYGRYIEPFFGGGALFFSLKPDNAIIADSNPELINMYLQVAHHVDDVIECLQKYENTSEMFYEVRSLNWQTLPKAEAAARTIYLNKTCFNGLYRVNRNGQFNTPFGKYKNPKICDIDALSLASEALRKADILCGDYTLVLEHYAQPGDFVFLDPPYLPISENSDFKRYTKEQFYEDDHIELAKMIGTLHERGCYVILTNSNHPLVHQLYEQYKIEVIQTKRHISCHGDTRKGEDVIVTIPPEKKKEAKIKPLSDQVSLYPPTRFMGSKRKLLGEILNVASRFEFDTVVDLFSGSGIVGYMFKSHGKTVISNDYMAMSATFTKAMVENNAVTLPMEEAEKLLIQQGEIDHFVSDTFKDLYYTDKENELIDILRTNIAAIDDQYKKAIAMTALIRACTKKRPRGIFTYIGHRYDDGRKDLQKSLSQQFLEAVEAVNNAVFDNGALDVIYAEKYRHIDEHLCLRPFPQNISDPTERADKWKKYREEMLAETGVSIFIFGNKKDAETGSIIEADGCMKEFEIAKSKGNIIIPIGSTGYAAKTILENVKKDMVNYHYLSKYIDILETETDISKLIRCVIEIIQTNLY